jgi:hypothetical protein
MPGASSMRGYKPAKHYYLSPLPNPLGNCSMHRIKRLLLALYPLHGPGQPLNPGYARSNGLTFSMQSSRREREPKEQLQS